MPRLVSSAAAACTLLLSACAAFQSPHNPQREGQTVSLVNSLSWTHPLSGKRDGARTAWPLTASGPAQRTEYFPLAQLRQCEEDGTCKWGVLSAQRTVDKVRYRPDGVTLDLDLLVDIDRRQQVRRADLDTALAIPGDVPVLVDQRRVQRTLALDYGKVEHIDIGYGIGYDICVERLNASRQPVERCAVPFF